MLVIHWLRSGIQPTEAAETTTNRWMGMMEWYRHLRAAANAGAAGAAGGYLRPARAESRRCSAH